MTINVKTTYPDNADAASLDYITGSFRNDSTPSSEDGTPLEVAWMNDFLGSRDAILAEGGVTPSGVPDTAQESDVLDALKQIIADNTPDQSTPIVSGLVVTNNVTDLEHDIDISAGRYGSNILAAGMTKRLDATFSAGTGNGGMVGTLPASGVVYIFFIRKDSDGSLDVYAETTNGATPPSGWSIIKCIAIRPTDADGNLINVSVIGNGSMLSISPVALVADISATNPSTTRTLYPVSGVLSCPPNVRAKLLVSYESLPSGQATAVLITSVNQSDVDPDITTMHTLSASSQSTRSAAEIDVYIGSSRQIYARRTAENGQNLKVIVTGWIEDRS
ncbi:MULTISPECIES: hypothetical protein [unclassified Methylophaga]|jgi:hypothetical protein|uniref:hypothetical protein n=1 Tax=unclassified Methylophaga TaxID=2629249 RepID=UPI00259CED22|nr:MULTISPECIES: hypothetical protein [unclassified Methylophaga]|tara:strand:- start:6635 stop:7633 length:999 start_codon:yes stop_codon:yes gene_type:complete